MADDLIERLRQATVLNYAHRSEVTCHRAEDVVKTACRDAHDGHLCYWTDAPKADGSRHRRYKHRCLCGVEWGEGERA